MTTPFTHRTRSTKAGATKLAVALVTVALLAVIGVFVVPRLMPGSADGETESDRSSVVAPTIQATDDGPAPAEFEELGRPEIPAAAATSAADRKQSGHDRLDAVLAKSGSASLTGVVIDAQTGSPIVGDLLIRLSPGKEPPSESRWRGMPANLFGNVGNGQFRLGGHPTGHYNLRVEVDGYKPHVELLKLPLPAPMTVTLDRGRWVHGYVKDAYGNTVENMEVTLVPEGSRNAFERTQTTDLKGRYIFRDIDPGRWHVEISGIQGVEEVPVSPTFTLSDASPEAMWDAELPELTVLEIKLTYDRMVLSDPIATLASRKGARIVTRVKGTTARFAAVPPGFYDLTIGRADTEPWYYEWVEVPESTEPVQWSRKITLPKKNPNDRRKTMSAETNAKFKQLRKGHKKRKTEDG